MSHHQTHRGAAPEDEELFSSKEMPAFRAALHDLHWLLDHGYAITSSLELVGNRYALVNRQRMAVARCVCSSAACLGRRKTQVDAQALNGQELWLDGFNVLTAVEVALGGGFILKGLDGCFRDMAGVHARYRRVAETVPAIHLIGNFLTTYKAQKCIWWLDRPVSNSGRLKKMIEHLANENNWNWTVELVFSPDKVLSETDRIIATADSVILDRCQRWINLSALVIIQHIPTSRLIDIIV